jgi:hypothetical protein
MKLDKVLPRAFIRWYCGYKSTNIYRIWVPQQHRVIAIRDVTFNPSEQYSPNKEVSPDIEAILKLVEIPDLNIAYDEQKVIRLPIPRPL